MTANTGALARLLEQATPGPWIAMSDSVLWAGDEMIGGCERHDDARLIALAPDAVRLLTDMAEELEQRYVDRIDEEVLCAACDSPPHADSCPIVALLARFAELEARSAQ